MSSSVVCFNDKASVSVSIALSTSINHFIGIQHMITAYALKIHENNNNQDVT